MKKQYQFAVILFTLSLFACSKTASSDAVSKIQPQLQSQAKLTRKDCTILEAELARVSEEHYSDMLKRALSDESQINEISPSEEEQETASLIPKSSVTPLDENSENILKRIKKREAELQLRAVIKAVLKAQTNQLNTEFAQHKEKLTAEIKTCIDSIDQ